MWTAHTGTDEITHTLAEGDNPKLIALPARHEAQY
jgi:hypothetical protein